MINLKNKPITLFVAGPILGVGMLLAIGYVLYAIVQSFSALKDIGLVSFVSVAFILFYLLQIVAYMVGGYFLLRGIYRWSAAAIILNAIVTPIVLAIVLTMVANQFSYVINLSKPLGVGILSFFLLMPLILGAIAYNDLHYRLPKVTGS